MRKRIELPIETERLDDAAALHVLKKLGFARQGETAFEGRRCVFFVRHR